MDADLLVRAHADTVAYGQPDLVTFSQDDRGSGHRRLLAVAGSDIYLVYLVFNHPIRQYTIFKLLCRHFNPMLGRLENHAFTIKASGSANYMNANFSRKLMGMKGSFVVTNAASQ